MIKAVLFDLDGVLVEAVDLHRIAFLEALRPHKEVSEEYHQEHLNGLPTKKKLERLGFYNDQIEEINSKKQEITFDLIPDMIKPVPEVLHVVNHLKKNSIPFAVCCNSIRKSCEMLLEYAGVEGFDFIISNQEVVYPKPHPEMYVQAIHRLGLRPEEVLIVEDSPVGLEAAYATGAQVCEIKNPRDIGKVLEVLEAQ